MTDNAAGQQAQITTSAGEQMQTGFCPLRCGYFYPIPACVRLHLIQHHDYSYAEAREACPDE